jgi:hypothetical protein
VIDSLDLPLTSSSLLLKKQEENSWFKINQYDFRDGTGKWDWKKGIAPGDQIAWGSWPEHVVKRLN